MIRKLKDKWVGISEEQLYESVTNCLTLGAGLKTSEFTVDDVKIEPNYEFVTDADLD